MQRTRTSRWGRLGPLPSLPTETYVPWGAKILQPVCTVTQPSPACGDVRPAGAEVPGPGVATMIFPACGDARPAGAKIASPFPACGDARPADAKVPRTVHSEVPGSSTKISVEAAVPLVGASTRRRALLAPCLKTPGSKGNRELDTRGEKCGAGGRAHQRMRPPKLGSGLPMRGCKLAEAKETREAENINCVGGLRNPNQAVSKSAHLQNTGARARRILENLMTNAEIAAEALGAGSVKRRFVIDLLRSGFNGGTAIRERIVLPQLLDFVNGILDLMEYNAPEDCSEDQVNIELMTMDFTDAFYTLWLEWEALGDLAFRTLDGWAIFLRLCFGMAGAPLVWGRVAAAACRLSQAIFAAHELRIQCYVDDPAVAVRGTAKERKHLLAMLLLFWGVLGLDLSFGKGTRGSTVPWIGATISLWAIAVSA